MTEVVLFVILMAVVLGFGFVVYILNQRLSDLKQDSGSAMLKQDLMALNEGVTSLKDGLKSHLTERLDKNQESMMRQLSSLSLIHI